MDDNFAINETDIITKGFEDFFGVIAIVGWIVGGFSLLVGGFGIYQHHVCIGLKNGPTRLEYKCR
ncbi:MAG: hypothetical protein R2764_21330 [Bacteroidales bacterium]